MTHADRTKSDIRNADGSPPTSRPDAWLAPSVVAATCLWLGRIPFAPGTWGAAFGVGVSLASGLVASHLTDLCGGAVPSPAIEAAILVAANLAAIPVCTAAARRIGRGTDPGAIVLDEAASLPLGMLAVPFADRTWAVLAVGWFVHRVFDVWKPFPCRQLEKLPAGLGVMADDWAAAAWMAVVLLAGRSLA